MNIAPSYATRTRILLGSWRRSAGTKLLHTLVGRRIPSILSDDCWGGEVYQYLRLPYRSPLVGTFIAPPGHLEILAAPHEVLNRPLRIVLNERPFPVGYLGSVQVWFMHETDAELARQKWERRLERVQWDNLFYKIDLGKPAYAEADRITWNTLKLEKSVALTPDDAVEVWRGVKVPDWIDNGKQMFGRSLQVLSVFDLLLRNEINPNSGLYDRFHRLFVK